MPHDHRARLRTVRQFDQLVTYLADELQWPIETADFEDLTFDYDAEDLGLDVQTAAKIQQIKQLRPLVTNQPWGIFFVQFEPKRLPVVALRRILGRLVIKKRASAHTAELASWQLHDLLFISSYGEGANRQLSLAHFTENEQVGDLPTLRVLGWDGNDRDLKLDHVHHELHTKLCWPADDTDLNAWREQWSSVFTLRHREVITTSQQLAVRLADLASSIRRKVNAALAVETAQGPMRKLMQAFQEALIHDLKADDFADMYAQTIAYGLLSARVSRQSGALVVDDVALMVPITSPFLRELMETFLHLGGRKQRGSVSAAIDFDEMGINDVVDLLRQANMEAVLRDFDNRNPQEDPVLHFYELFLKEYDAKKRMQRGVFYTPKPVVSYIVRSVHELLQHEFGLEDGLADTATWQQMCTRHPDITMPQGVSPDQPFVQILDPATGTATFLVEVIDVIHRTLTTKWTQQGLIGAQQHAAWNEYVPQYLLPRLHGYELMMAPYAIAQMKIGLKLYETGYRFRSDERARIYLTNTLEPPQDFSDRLAFDAPALAHEAQAVNAVKRHQRFTVVIGNPPYSHLSSNLTPEAMAIVEPYKYINGERIQERGALSLQKNLQDDYVKFVRIAERTIETAGLGVVGLITNNSYLDSRSFRGMRFHLSQTFNKGWILDLHGSGKKDEAVGDGASRDANVFDIVQGVAIALWGRCPSGASSIQIRRADILGARDQKYGFLATHTLGTSSWQSLQLAPPFFPFVQQDLQLLGEYQTFTSLREIFPVYSSGVKTHRDDFAYSFTAQEAEEKLREFCDGGISDQALRDRFGLKDTNVWSLHTQRTRVKFSALQQSIMLALYRPFDVRATCFSDEIIELVRRAVMDQMLDGKNLALLCSQQQAEEGFRHVFCTRLISDWGSVSNRTRESTSAFPLWLSRPVRRSLNQDNLGLGESTRPNVNPAWLRTLGSSESVFHFVYSVLHSPSYRTRYAAFLRSDFPRLPLTGNLELFHALAWLGGELVALHLLESPRLDQLLTTYIGPAHPEVKRVGWANNAVWLDAPPTPRGATAAPYPGTMGFHSVPEAVWNFHIGGYQVCEKWLKDRKGRLLSQEDIVHYHRIVVALAETLRLMKEVDDVIDQHGSWPNAFI